MPGLSMVLAGLAASAVFAASRNLSKSGPLTPTTIPGFGPLRETGDKLNLLAQATGMLDRSLDRFPGRRSDTDASAEDTRSATGDARRDEVEETAGETQPASATRVADSEMSNAAPENGRVVAAQTNFSSGSPRPRRRRHAHGGALPR